MRNKYGLWLILVMFVLSGCATLPGPWHSAPRAPLTDDELGRTASAGLMQAREARVFTDNDQAFLSKVRLIEGAKRTIDLAYYIYSDDYSSSYLTRALIDAARRGVAVRVLVDYQTNYQRLDLFSMMEAQGNSGSGSLRVKLYGRPTRNIMKDAVYMTLACDKNSAAKRPLEDCSQQKFDRIDALFANETIDGQPAAAKDISNLDIGNSGLFLSGYYAKRPDVIATAIQTGQGVDPTAAGTPAPSAEDKQNLKKLGKAYWESRTGNVFERLRGKAELLLAFSLFGPKIDPIDDMFNSLVPAQKSFTAAERGDWDHITDYSHHKFLFVDAERLQLGGRNVEDSYHMHPNALTEKYVFMDTDLYAQLAGGGDRVTSAYDALWGFDRVVASLAEVRQHAPNEFVANIDAYAEAQKACAGKTGDAGCGDREFAARSRTLAQRIAARAEEMKEHADRYATAYLPQVGEARTPTFKVDDGAALAYLENLPFDKSLPADKRTRTYGAPAGSEAANGKYIHEAWLRGLADACRSATAAQPKRIVLHNAYFYPAANLTYALSQLANGALDCSHVTVTVLTNSIQTTDLNIVNLLARHSLKAFAEFYRDASDAGRRANFDYYEYVPPTGQANLSLHSKVSVLGDDLIVGSANADVRSFMMDSNNGMLVRRAPDFLRAYVAFVDGIIAQPSRVRKLNDYFLATPRDTIKAEDLETFRAILKKYHADKHLDAPQQARLEAKFSELLDDAYTMTRASIAGKSPAKSRNKAQDEFNELFKPI